MRFDLRPTDADFEITLSFRHRTNVPGLVHFVETSRDAQTWATDDAAMSLRRIDQSPDGQNFILETRVYQFTPSSPAQQFFRVTVVMTGANAVPEPVQRREKQR